MWWGHGFAGFWCFGIFLLVIVGICMLGHAFAIHHWRGGWHHGEWNRFDPAESLLRQRYARGEIDAEEYQRRREELRH